MLAYYRDFKFNEIYKINIEDPKQNFNYQQGGSQQIKLERSYISEQRENMQNQYLKNNFSYQPSTQQALISEPFDKNNSQSELKKEKKGFSFFGKSKKADENLKKNNYCEILKNLYIQNMSEYEKTQLYINGNDNNNKKKKKEKEKIAGWDLRIQQKVPFAQDEEFEGDSGMQIIWLLFNFIRGVSFDNKFVLRTTFFLKDFPKDRTNAIKLDNINQFLVLKQENSIYQLNLNFKKESKMQEIKDKYTQTYIEQQNDTDMTPKNLKMNQTQMNLTQLQQSVLSQKNDTASNINQNTGIISQGQKNQETIMEYQYNNKMFHNAYQICQECEKKLKDLQILQRENERLKYILQYKELSIQKQNNMLGNYAKQNNELKEKNTELNALAQRLKSQQIYVSQLMAEQKLTVKNDKNQGSRYIRSKTSQNIKYLPPNPKKQINQNSTLGQKSNFKLKPLLQSGSQNQSIIVPNKVVGVEKYLQENSIKQDSQKNLSYMDNLQSPQKFYSQQKKQVELKKLQNEKEIGNNSHLVFQKNDQFLDESEKNKINQHSSKRPSTTEKNLISPTKFSNSSKFQPTFFNAEDFEKQKNEQKSQLNQQIPSLNMTNQSFKRSQSQLKSKTIIKKAMNSTNTPLGTKTRRELLEIYDQTEELETFSQQFQQSLKILEKWKMSNLKIYQDDVFAIENLLQDKLNMDSPQNKEFFAGQLVFYFKEFRHAIDLLQVQHQIQSYTFNSFNFQDIYHKIVNSLKQLFQCEKLLLYIYNGQSNEFIAQQDQQKQEINQQGNTQSTFNQFGDNKTENGEKIIKLKPEKGILQEAFTEKVLKKIDNISSVTQFCPEIDGAIQKKVKNLIWSPCLDEQGDIKAMIQIVNFQTQEQNRNINRDDKLSLQVMGKCIGNLLKGAEKFKIAIMGQNRLNQVIKQEQKETSTFNFEKYQSSQSFLKKCISLQTVEKYFKNNNSNFNKKWQQSQIISNYYADEDFEVTEIDKFVGICGQCLKNEQQIILENHQRINNLEGLIEIKTKLDQNA
ncbi:hypothetical protein PPERSA_10459 [Pseudocohnilembus persalinus]|uniref:GAF domain-containing protein n=1 Tax=Pseudocohnilembus persalinus TaxID=266149 RepID=A0A0V0R0U6_PSEPJ|nr:hypothetical protein PPERSA_10459 [Pseudocohnilembus persalinus]|eukprot:KRX08097.1 hypothetical protein PPERSA_10459 [Pseudocohnilembus persalinus]